MARLIYINSLIRSPFNNVCGKGLLSIPRKKKKCSHSLGLTRGKEKGGLDNIYY